MPRWSLLIYFLLAMLGCLLQVYHISDQFFEYDTVTQLTMRRPINAKPPALILCFFLSQCYDPKIVQKYGLNTSDKQLPEKITLDQIFELTPTLQDQFKTCRLRTQGYRLSDRMKGNENCKQHFEIVKFYKQRLICFYIKLKDERPFFLEQLYNSIQFAKYYQVTMVGTGLEAATHYMTFVSDSKLRFDGRSDSYEEHNRMLLNESSGEGNQSFITLTYARYESTLLEKPYKTDCLNYQRQLGFQSKGDCFETCVLKQAITELRKAPFSIAYEEPSPHMILSFDDLKDDAKAAQLDKVEVFCRSRCSKKDCHKEDFTPKIISSESYTGVGFEIYAPNEPDVITTFVPRTSLVDYITMVFSCIGFWFGFSPLYFFKDFDVLSMVHGMSRKQSLRKASRIKSSPKSSHLIANQEGPIVQFTRSSLPARFGSNPNAILAHFRPVAVERFDPYRKRSQSFYSN